jgi:hypothetical protein
MEYVHAHAPEALIEVEGHDPLGLERWLEPGAVLLLAMAAVLFFAGISLRLDWRPLRIAVIAMAAGLLASGGAYVLTLPLA